MISTPTPAGLRAITVQQPWAWAIAHGGKTIENRSRTLSYRGPLAIHAGKAWARRGAQDPRVRQALAPHRTDLAATGEIIPAQYPGRFTAGAIIAIADLVDVHPGTGCCPPWGHTPDPADATPVHHLVLAAIRPLATPIACPGALGLWRPPTHLAALLTPGGER